MNKLDTFIKVKQRFLKSINLNFDLKEEQFLDSFVLQGSSLSCLHVMGTYLTETRQRAFTWTGPYGSGKSSLALFFSGLAGKNTDCETKYLEESVHAQLDPNLLDFFRTRESWDVVTVVGRNGNLTEDLISAANYSKLPLRAFLTKFAGDLSDQKKGAIIFIDELGKYLENGNADNCYALQEIAEFINKTDSSIVLIGILHQAFQAYADPNSLKQQEEWMKVQGRFADIPLIVSIDESLTLIGNSFEKSGKPPKSREFLALATRVVQNLNRTAKDRKLLAKQLVECWPLHPVSALLLGPISKKRFFQNTRSIFSFLCSKEINGFDEFIRITSLDSGKLFSPWMLFDYLKSNYEQAILAAPAEGKKWLVSEDGIERVEKNGSELELKIIKTIAILELFRAGSGLDATQELVSSSLNDYGQEEIEEALRRLQHTKIIIYKKYRNAYNLYEGTDVNIDEKLKKLQQKNDELPLSSLTSEIAFQPVVAHEHYDKTGALRWFRRLLTTKESLLDTITKAAADHRNGTFIACLINSSEEELKRLTDEAKEILVRLNNPLVAITFCNVKDRFKEQLKDYFNSLELSKDSEISDDRIARRELEEKLSLLQKDIFEEIQNIFSDKAWITLEDSELDSIYEQDLSRLASEICSRVYCSAPLFCNELINREKPSSQIKRAQKQLMHAMVVHGNEENLGISGFPPEMMIYLSLLKATGIHSYNENLGTFNFKLDNLKNNFSPVFSFLSELLRKEEQFNLNELCEKLSLPPFGIKKGLSPILLLAFVLAKRNEISIYLENVFQPSLTEELVDFWTISPKDISFKFIENNASNNALLSEISNALNLDRCASPLEVARELVKNLLALPTWVHNSSSVPPKELLMRDAILKAWDPIALIFKELPKIAESQDPKVIASTLQGMFKHLEELQPKKFDHFLSELYSFLGESDRNFETLKNRATKILSMDAPFQLKGFIGRIANSKDELTLTEGTLSICIGKPKNKWTEQDISTAHLRLAELCLSFKKLEALGYLKGYESPTRAFSILWGDRHQFLESRDFYNVQESESSKRFKEQLKTESKKFSKDEAVDALLSVLLDLTSNK